MPWIYAPPFLWIWLILKITWLFWIDQIFLYFLHPFCFLGHTCSCMGDSLTLYAFLKHILGRHNGVRWPRQFMVIHFVPEHFQSAAVAPNLSRLKLQVFRHQSNKRQNNELTSRSHLQVFQPAVRSTPQSYWLHESFAFKYPQRHRHHHHHQSK